MKSSSVTVKAVTATNLRIDASYHLSDGQQIKRMIDASPYELLTINDVCSDIFIGNRAKRVYVTNRNNGIPFLSSSDILEADLENVKLASKKYTPNIQQMTLKKGWTLISRSGTIGNCAFANAKHAHKLASEDVIRCVPNHILRQGMLYAYLASKYGHSLLTQGTFGGVIQHIETDFVGSLPIPHFPDDFQIQIDGLIQRSAQLRETATDLLDEAYSLFYSANNMDISPSLLAREEKLTSNCRSISLSNMKTASIKAMNYSLRSEKIIDILRSKKHILLSDYLSQPFRMGVRASFKRIEACYNGENLISQGDIHKLNPTSFKKVRVKQENDGCRAKRGTLIMPSAGTLGENEVFTRPLLVRSNYEGLLLSEVIGVFDCKSEEDAAYLYIFLSSKIGFRLLRNMCCGTNLMYPMWPFMKEIPIPICSDESYSRIAELVLKAFDMRGEANRLENDAICKVESLIEKWS